MIKVNENLRYPKLLDYGLSNDEGVMALEIILAHPHSQVIVSKRLLCEEKTNSIMGSTKYFSSQREENENSFADRVKLIWQGVLGVNEILLDSDFFILGGDSLTAIQLSYKLKVALGIEISPGFLLEHSRFEHFLIKIQETF